MLVPVKYSGLSTPTVPTIIQIMPIKIWWNFKCAVNPELEAVKYSLPRMANLFVQLIGGKIFSKIYLSEAYQ